MSGLHVVLGSNGGTGSAVLQELVRRELPARGVTRSGTGFQPEGAELVDADITDAEGLASALAGAAVVYQCAQPPYTRWPQEFPDMNRRIIEATAAVGAELVFADNLYMYAPGTNPLREDSPATAQGMKGRTRVEMAAELLRADAEGKLRVAIGRSSDYYGPRGLDSGLGERVFASVLRGKKLSWLGSLDQPHTVSYLPDMARGLVTLGTEVGAHGEVWHLPAGPAVTGREFLAAVCDAAETPHRISAVSPLMLQIAGIFSPMIREIKETTYQWTDPWVVDTSKFQSAFGPFVQTPMTEAIAATVEWFRRREASR
jgi:nucleoside-diphosphate-sugar epimerase